MKSIAVSVVAEEKKRKEEQDIQEQIAQGEQTQQHQPTQKDIQEDNIKSIAVSVVAEEKKRQQIAQEQKQQEQKRGENLQGPEQEKQKKQEQSELVKIISVAIKKLSEEEQEKNKQQPSEKTQSKENLEKIEQERQKIEQERQKIEQEKSEIAKIISVAINANNKKISIIPNKNSIVYPHPLIYDENSSKLMPEEIQNIYNAFIKLLQNRISNESNESEKKKKYEIFNQKINKIELIKLNLLHDLIVSYENQIQDQEQDKEFVIIKKSIHNVFSNNLDQIKELIQNSMEIRGIRTNAFHKEFENLIKNYNKGKDIQTNNDIKFIYIIYFLQNITLDKLFKKI